MRPQLGSRPAIAVLVSGLVAMTRPTRAASAASAFGRSGALPARALTNAVVLAGVLLVPGLADATTHDHLTFRIQNSIKPAKLEDKRIASENR